MKNSIYVFILLCKIVPPWKRTSANCGEYLRKPKVTPRRRHRHFRRRHLHYRPQYRRRSQNDRRHRCQSPPNPAFTDEVIIIHINKMIGYSLIDL